MYFFEFIIFNAENGSNCENGMCLEMLRKTSMTIICNLQAHLSLDAVEKKKFIQNAKDIKKVYSIRP